MNPEQENFEQLRRLLALKRHEQPPPGYFDRFSVQVIARIRAGEQIADESWFERLFGEVSWFQRFWAAFESKPVLAGSVGLAVCGMLAVGVVYSDQVEPGNMAVLPVAASEQPVATHFASQLVQPGFEQMAFASLTSTGGVNSAQQQGSLFDQIRRPRGTLVNYTFPVGGH